MTRMLIDRVMEVFADDIERSGVHPLSVRQNFGFQTADLRERGFPDEMILAVVSPVQGAPGGSPVRFAGRGLSPALLKPSAQWDFDSVWPPLSIPPGLMKHGILVYRAATSFAAPVLKAPTYRSVMLCGASASVSLYLFGVDEPELVVVGAAAVAGCGGGSKFHAPTRYFHSEPS
jgi:hypothetical protein